MTEEAQEYTIHSVSEGFYKEKGSRFIGVLYPAPDMKAFENALAALKKKFYDARHICYAYRIGANVRENDDGEPSHSAGAPIMRQLLSAQLVYSAAFVIRYFGGVKLGVPGLIRAYGTAAEEAIRSAQLVEYFDTVEMRIEFDYPQTNMVKYLVEQHNLRVISTDFAENCVFLLEIKASELDLVKPIFDSYVTSIKINP